jgi:DNA-directed RNA polymerase specialized sigma24 family protein
VRAIAGRAQTRRGPRRSLPPLGAHCLYGLRHLRNEDRARDLVQAVLLAVWRPLAQRASPIPARRRFMLGTCRNVAQRMRRAMPTTRRCRSKRSPLPTSSTTVDMGALIRCMAELDSARATS